MPGGSGSAVSASPVPIPAGAGAGLSRAGLILLRSCRSDSSERDANPDGAAPPGAVTGAPAAVFSDFSADLSACPASSGNMLLNLDMSS